MAKSQSSPEVFPADFVRIKCLGISFGHPENFVIISDESQASPADVNDTRGRFLRDGSKSSLNPEYE
jgi:hypothetical protein